MQFSLLTLLSSAALAAAANSVTFVSLDETERTIYFVPNAGLASIDPVKVPGMGTSKATIPQSWVGNWYSVSDGAENTTGMLGEVAFQGWKDLTYYDVSAIVNANDHNGVKQLFPASGKTPTSGCDSWPCNNAYYLPDDIQTKTTSETDLICTLGNNGISSASALAQRDVEHEETPSVKRDFVLGGYAN